MTNIKIGFVLLSNRQDPIPSTRISILNMLPYLERSGYEPHVLFEPDHGNEEPNLTGVVDRAVSLGIDIVYFQKVRGRSAVETASQLSARGIKTIYGVCDLVETEMAEATDATVVVTDYLKSLYDARLHKKMFVVHDGIENPEICVKQYREHSGSRSNPLRAVLVTSHELSEIPTIETPPKFVSINIVGDYKHYPFLYAAKRHYWKFLSRPNWIDKLRYLRGFCRRDFVKTNWDITTVYQIMSDCDIGIIPVDMTFDPLPQLNVSRWQVKSENRLTLNMAMGLPVIASPVPAYKDIIVQGENGYLATTRAEWLACFEALRDPQRRSAIGRKARESVIQRYSKEEQALKLLAVLRLLGRAT
jgi:glycosyltransferase involved in cell wall biosynthesis